MKDIIKIGVFLLFCMASTVFGQPPSPPASVSIDGKTYFRHGFNSTGAGLTLQTPREDVDSVTITSSMRYFVMPDPRVSPLFDVENLPAISNVNSTFNWTIAPLGHGAITSTPSNNPLITVQWNMLGAGTLTVLEVPSVGQACDGDHQTVMPVLVIARPTIAFTPINTEYLREECEDDITGGHGVNIDMSVFTQSAQVEITFTVTKDGVPYTGFGGATPIRLVNNRLPIIFTEYGRYVFTITGVTDRISRKSSVTGIVTTADDAHILHVHMLRPVETGPIFRIPNNF